MHYANDVSSKDRPELTRGRVISHKIHASSLKLALPTARLGGQPSLMINDLIPPLRAGREAPATQRCLVCEHVTKPGLCEIMICC